MGKLGQKGSGKGKIVQQGIKKGILGHSKGNTRTFKIGKVHFKINF